MGAALPTPLLATPPAPQPSSPLFSVLPAEVRSHIFTLALTDYPDPSPDKHYDSATCFTRPSYFAPRRSDTALLRTCRAAFLECWYLPYILKEQTHWLTARSRSPPEYDEHADKAAMTSRLGHISKQLGEDVEIRSLRVFAQMYRLEEGGLAELLRNGRLNPRSLTLTIRHADWWYWEDDEPLRFDGGWLEAVSLVLPASVRELHIELESLERKKDQIDGIVKQMCERWLFKRKDGAVLWPDVTGRSNEVTRWSGTSTWHSQRWVRDETGPGKIDYYMVDVVFRPEPALERAGGSVSEVARETAKRGRNGNLKLHLPEAKAMSMPSDTSPYEYVWDEDDSDGGTCEAGVYYD